MQNSQYDDLGFVHYEVDAVRKPPEQSAARVPVNRMKRFRVPNYALEALVNGQEKLISKTFSLRFIPYAC